MIISAFFYSLTTFVLAMIIFSYYVALRMDKKLNTLASLFFMFSVFLITLSASVNIWSQEVFNDFIVIPLGGIRATLMFVASVFFLCTLWKQNK